MDKKALIRQTIETYLEEQALAIHLEATKLERERCLAAIDAELEPGWSEWSNETSAIVRRVKNSIRARIEQGEHNGNL